MSNYLVVSTSQKVAEFVSVLTIPAEIINIIYDAHLTG